MENQLHPLFSKIFLFLNYFFPSKYYVQSNFLNKVNKNSTLFHIGKQKKLSKKNFLYSSAAHPFTPSFMMQGVSYNIKFRYMIQKNFKFFNKNSIFVLFTIDESIFQT